MAASTALRLIVCLALIFASSANLGAMIIGRDERNDPAAYPSLKWLQRFSNEGRIECPVPWSPDLTFLSTGWLTGAADTLVTVAHSWHVEDAAKRIVRVDPKTCDFVTYSSLGKVLDRVPLAYVESYWDQARYDRDSSYDFAVVKLTRKPKHMVSLPIIADGRLLNGSNVSLIAHHNDVPNNTIARLSRGKIFPMPRTGTGQHGVMKISENKRVYITDLDANYGSSGGMLLDEFGRAIGIHVGAISPGAVTHGNFDPRKPSYNVGVYIDGEMTELIRKVAEHRIK